MKESSRKLESNLVVDQKLPVVDVKKFEVGQNSF